MNSTIDDQTAGGQNLDEPHFDEEATILAARPVVPLEEVRETKRSKRGMALAFAIGGGLLVGLLAATLIYRYLSVSQPAPQPTVVAEQPVNQLPAVAGGATASVTEAEPPPVEEEKPIIVPEDRDTQPAPEEPRTARTRESASEPAPRRPVTVREARRQADDEEDEEAERAMRRADRQEERRERRRALRQAKREERQSRQQPDDLTRIREIFEGSPRP